MVEPSVLWLACQYHRWPVSAMGGLSVLWVACQCHYWPVSVMVDLSVPQLVSKYYN